MLLPESSSLRDSDLRAMVAAAGSPLCALYHLQRLDRLGRACMNARDLAVAVADQHAHPDECKRELLVYLIHPNCRLLSRQVCA